MTDVPDGSAQPWAAPAPPAEVTEPEAATGHPEVDAAVARLDELADLPVSEHVAVFDDVHVRLRDALSHLDTP